MSITILAKEAREESTYAITVEFYDENGEAVTPNAGTVTWSLKDTFGNIINNRDQEVISEASSVQVVLSGDDLALQDGETGNTIKRRFQIEAVFNTDLGNNLPFKDACQFNIRNLV